MKLYQKTRSDSGVKATTRGGNSQLKTTLAAVTPKSGLKYTDAARVTVELRVLPDGRVVCDIDTAQVKDLLIYMDDRRIYGWL